MQTLCNKNDVGQLVVNPDALLQESCIRLKIGDIVVAFGAYSNMGIGVISDMTEFPYPLTCEVDFPLAIGPYYYASGFLRLATEEELESFTLMQLSR